MAGTTISSAGEAGQSPPKCMSGNEPVLNVFCSGPGCIPLQRLCSISTAHTRRRVRLLQLPRVFRQEQLYWHRLDDTRGMTENPKIIWSVSNDQYRLRSSVKTPTPSYLPTLRRDPASWLPLPLLPPSLYSRYHTSTSSHTTPSLYMLLYSPQGLQTTPRSPPSGNAASPSFSQSPCKSPRT